MRGGCWWGDQWVGALVILSACFGGEFIFGSVHDVHPTKGWDVGGLGRTRSFSSVIALTGAQAGQVRAWGCAGRSSGMGRFVGWVVCVYIYVCVCVCVCVWQVVGAQKVVSRWPEGDQNVTRMCGS
jgi:hypothetical protein